jgi:lipid-A-disaccharide synthase
MADFTLMMVAGERSGDIYGARLARALRHAAGDLSIFGCGGDEMRAAGVETSVDAHEFAMVGITEVVSGLPRARRAFNRLVAQATRRHPQAAVLIDAPSLNMRLAKRLTRLGIQVIYFISPQIWAWKKWRIRHLQSHVDKMLCIFDFEAEIYRRAGVPVEYVGHPLVESVHPKLDRDAFLAHAGLRPDRPIVALLPGSRTIEARFNLPAMLAAATQLAKTRPVQFVMALAPALSPEWVQQQFLNNHASGITIKTVAGLPYDVLRYADAAVIASGTATVEAALLGTPMVVVYRVSRVTAFLARHVLDLDVPYYSMVNLLAGKRIVPELVQEGFTAEALRAELASLLDSPEARAQQNAELARISARLGAGGAIDRAAEAIAGMLLANRKPVTVA